MKKYLYTFTVAPDKRLISIFIFLTVIGGVLVSKHTGMDGLIRYVLINIFFLYYLTSNKKDMGQFSLKNLIPFSIAVYGIITMLYIAYQNMIDPGEWDWLCYFIAGKVAALGNDLYDPNNYHLVYQTFNIPVEVDNGFRTRFLDVGLTYQPPSFLFLVPFGYFDYYTFHLLWNIVNLVLLFFSILIFKKIFFNKESSLYGLIYSSCCILMLQAVKNTLMIEQIHYYGLVLLLLGFLYLNKDRSAIFFALSFFVKPMALLWGGFYLFKKRWKAVAFGITTILIAYVLSIIVFGLDNFIEFYITDWRSKFPADKYLETENLLKFLIVTSDYEFTAEKNPVFYPPFILLSSFLTIFTFFLIAKANTSYDKWVLSLLVMLSVSIYPGALFHYNVYMVVIIGLILTESRGFFKHLAIKLTFLYIIITLTYLDVFFANLLCWLIASLFILSETVITQKETKKVVSLRV